MPSFLSRLALAMALLYAVSVAASAAAEPNTGGDFSEVRGLLRATTAEGPRQLGDISGSGDGAASGSGPTPSPTTTGPTPSPTTTGPTPSPTTTGPTPSPTTPTQTPTVPPTSCPTTTERFDQASGCATKMADSDEFMDQCTCEWYCKKHASWTTSDSTSMPADAVLGISDTTSSADVAWRAFLGKMKGSGATDWVPQACEKVCSVGADSTKIESYGVHNTVVTGHSSAQAFTWVTAQPSTPASSGSSAGMTLPATMYAVAKAARMKREIVKGNGYQDDQISFEVTMQGIKVLQCITEQKMWKKCCQIPNAWNTANDYSPYTYSKRFFEQNTAKGNFTGGNCNTDADECWKKENPPVSCSVKKSIMVFKICMKAKKVRGQGWVNDTRAESSRCWNPTAKPHCAPQPFGSSSVNWEVDPTRTDKFYAPFKCYKPGSSYTDGNCRDSPFTDQARWSLTEGIGF